METRKRTRSKFLLRLLGATIVLLAIIGAGGLSFAQSPASQWSPPRRIPGYEIVDLPPYMVADQNRTVHAFGSQDVDGEVAVIYSQWRVDLGWTEPVDILLSLRSRWALIRGAYLDAQGMIHVAFYRGNEQGGDIYYSRAAAIHAGRALAWSTPKLVGQDANYLNFSAALAGDNEGNLFIVYGGFEMGNGLYAVYSSDGGDTWSEPTVVFLTDDAETYPGTIAVHLDRQGQLHVAWSVWRPPFGGQALYYARLDADHKQWSMPIALRPSTRKDSIGPDYPVIFTYHNTLFLIYHDLTNGRVFKLMRQSRDNGRTWTNPERAFWNPSLEGGHGAAVLLVDSNDVMHAVLANRGWHGWDGMWHSVWQDDRWGESQNIITGLRTPEFGPTAPRAVVSQGNVILVTWAHDVPTRESPGVWYSYTILDSPELPVSPLPALLPTLTPTVTAVPRTSTPTAVLPRPTVTPWAAGPSAEVPVRLSSPGQSVLVGVLPVLVLIGLVILGRTRR